MVPAPTEDLPAALPSPAATLRQRVRRLRARARGRGGVELQGQPLLGRGVRFEVARGARVIVGDGARIGDRCRVHVHGGTVTIAGGAVLGDGCVIAARSGVQIGERCLLGEEVAIIDFDHLMDDVEAPIRLQGLVSTPVQIDAGAVLGVRTAVLRGVHVGAGALVGAHSVLTHDIAAGEHAQGTPARTPEQERAARRTAALRGRPRA